MTLGNLFRPGFRCIGPLIKLTRHPVLTSAHPRLTATQVWSFWCSLNNLIRGEILKKVANNRDIRAVATQTEGVFASRKWWLICYSVGLPSFHIFSTHVVLSFHQLNCTEAGWFWQCTLFCITGWGDLKNFKEVKIMISPLYFSWIPFQSLFSVLLFCTLAVLALLAAIYNVYSALQQVQSVQVAPTFSLD